MVKQNLINKDPLIEGHSHSHKPFAIIISAPSGTGKTTIIKRLVEEMASIKLSVSTTTRTPRIGEIEGKDYFFLANNNFQLQIQNDDFLEYDTIYGNFYGTSKKQIEEYFNVGNDVIFDINWYGASQIRSKIDSILIYLLPPSLNELKNRLISRSQDKFDIIQKRLQMAKEEIQNVSNYDYVLINDNLEQTIQQVKLIIDIERLKRDKKQTLLDFLQKETIIY